MLYIVCEGCQVPSVTESSKSGCRVYIVLKDIKFLMRMKNAKSGFVCGVREWLNG